MSTALNMTQSMAVGTAATFAIAVQERSTVDHTIVQPAADVGAILTGAHAVLSQPLKQ